MYVHVLAVAFVPFIIAFHPVPVSRRGLSSTSIPMSTTDNDPSVQYAKGLAKDVWSKTSGELFRFRKGYIPGGVTHKYSPGDAERDDIIAVQGTSGSGKTWFALGNSISNDIGNKLPDDIPACTFYAKLDDEAGELTGFESKTGDEISEIIGTHVKGALKEWSMGANIEFPLPMSLALIIDKAHRAGNALQRVDTLKAILEGLEDIVVRPRLIVVDHAIGHTLDPSKVYVVRMGEPDISKMWG